MKLVYAHEMQALDRYTIEEIGITGEILMENAGKGVAEIIWLRFGKEAEKGVVIICGPGNNGGDGFVVARHLAQRGFPIRVFLLTSPTKFKGEAALNLQILQRLYLPLIQLTEEDFSDLHAALKTCGLVVDAIFGTGLKREVTGIFAQVIKFMNESGKPIIAIDMPSGLSADTGKPLGIAVKATLTATMALPKVGQVIYPGREYTGELQIVDISMPPLVIEEQGPKREWLTEEWAIDLILPRKGDTHKGTYGHVLVLAGSTGKTGAAILSALGALRGGAGLVTLACPKSLDPIFETVLIEAMTVPIAQETLEGSLSSEAFDIIFELAKGKKAALIGPGLGLCQETQDLVYRVVAELPLPMVVDADALTCLSGRLSYITQAKWPRILTPHPGEMARLLRVDKDTVQSDRLGIARTAAREARAVVVLKGAATVIASPDGREAVNRTGNPGMATGGMGDVLSGLIAALLAQGFDPFEAACLGVFLHGLAGDLLAGEKGPWGYTASELAEKLPFVIKKLLFKREFS